MAVGAQFAHEIGEQREGVVEGLQVGDLRADVHVDARHGEAGQGPRAGVDGARAGERNAELVFRSSGGDLGVRARVDVRIDAKGEARDASARRGDLRERLQLRLGFDVEAENILLERQRHFGAGLADAGKNDLVRGHAGGAGAAQLALGDDVHPGAQARQGGEHRLIGIGLHRVAHQRRAIGEGGAEDAKMPFDGGARIAIERRADLAGNSGEIDVLGMQRAAAIGEMVHGDADLTRSGRGRTAPWAA